MNLKAPIVLIRGGGDLATGVAVRLYRSGFSVVVTEIPQPLAVRRLVSFAQAIFSDEVVVENVKGVLARDVSNVDEILSAGWVPVLIDEIADCRYQLAPDILVDGRMRKAPSEISKDEVQFIIGLGPGFRAGRDCHAIVETKRGHDLGRVIWAGSAIDDTGTPEPVAGHDVSRVLRAPSEGVLEQGLRLGTIVGEGDQIALVQDVPILAPFHGVLRGLLHNGIKVEEGMKIGDLDPRLDPGHASRISDKALAIGGGVLEAILSQDEFRVLGV